MSTTGQWPIWLLVLACGLGAQIVKLALYSAARRRLYLPAATRSTGLPSLHASSLSCLTVLLVLRDGWSAATTAAAMVMTVIVVHDSIRLRGVREEQRRVLHDLVTTVPAADRHRQRVLRYLDPLAHHPSHVGLGLLYGSLFALALGLPWG